MVNDSRTWLTKAANKVFTTSSSIDRREQRASLVKTAKQVIGDTYIEEDPLVAELFRKLVPSTQDVATYVKELFPSVTWIRRYNVHWFLGDVIAGNVHCEKEFHNFY